MATLLGETTNDVIASFMQQMIVHYQGYGEAYRRKEPRETVAVPVRVSPLTDELQPVGEPFEALTRDISCSGVGLFHLQPVDAPYVSIEMATPETQQVIRLLAKVEHCTRFGSFYIVGCRFAAIYSDEFGGPVDAT